MTTVGSALPAVADHAGLDWSRVGAATFELRQVLRYDYPGPVTDVAHRLMVVPPPRHGDQRRLGWSVAVSGADTALVRRRDRFGNLVVEVTTPHVAESLCFDVCARVERVGGGPVPASLRHHGWGGATRLTGPDPRLEAVAAALAAEAAGEPALGLVLRIGGWVHRALEYRHDVTGVRTTAAEALGLGAGVCQDYAHLMLALCHLCGIRARYVSGHLVGEGGSHAWVEVRVPGGRRGDGAVVVAFDPTHDRVAGLSYLTVAVGRDYADVAPTSGTFRATFPGRLTVTKRLALADWRQ